MHATQLLDTYLKKHCQGIHKTRMTALITTTLALMRGRKLSVTGLGRAIQTRAKSKHNIKRADRLIGSAKVHRDRPWIYRALAKLMIGMQRRPVILIDWSDLSANREFHLLRASIPMGGRALTLYEESHRQCDNNHPKVHQRFLRQLHKMLPSECVPIIVTDAGFRTPWFRAVRKLGWDFVGRVGGQTMISSPEKEDWIRVECIFEMATTRARYLGEIDLVRQHPLRCHAYLLKKKKRGRIRKTVFGQRCEMKLSQKNAHRERTPWLIVTSMSHEYANTQQILNLYKTRMQIEEGFRDVKNTRWGLSLHEARCSTTQRYENLLLIAHMATLAIWMIGKIAELKKWHRQYQANTIKTHKVLSTFFLGIEVIKRGAEAFLLRDFVRVLKQLYQDHKIACGYV